MQCLIVYISAFYGENCKLNTSLFKIIDVDGTNCIFVYIAMAERKYIF